jgi:hypothetical protein
VFGGSGGPTLTETYNGTAWTAANVLNTGRSGLGGAGTQTSALAFGGPSSALTEDWNGTSWTEVADLATARSAMGSAGTSAAALASGGTRPASIFETATEEWTAGNAVKTFTAS